VPPHPPGGLQAWLLQDLRDAPSAHHKPHKAPWWQVMCLTGVDYFSTLGYQPALAFAAAGLLSPVATFVLVLLTLFGALPVYREIARLSPRGEGSISLLQELLTRWKGKALVLCLLGFAATDYVITITLSAADATAHILENPLVPHWVEHPVGVTLLLLAALGAIFLRGFREAIGLAVLLVIVYLLLNVVVIGWGLWHIAGHPELLPAWKNALFVQHGSWTTMIGVSLLLFPKLALGLSGFETGVAVMPLVQGDEGDTEAEPKGRVRGAHKLLLAAALIMSVLLMGSSFTSALLIPAELFAPGGAANGRALAYLAHEHFGEAFGTLYDVSTIGILWFAGASAMAGLLNLVPRYLPRYGMAPEWAKAMRPLVLVFIAITFLVTIIFDADVEAQGGAYATGVLVLMSSAALAVTLSAHRSGRLWQGYLLITLIFGYTTIQNIHERPEGIRIATFFIVTIVVTSLISRVLRSTELRITGIDADEAATEFIDQAATSGQVRVLANRPGVGDVPEYAAKIRQARDTHQLKPWEPVLFLEIATTDASDFSNVLAVRGVEIGPFRVLRCHSPAVPNAIAGLLLHIRDRTGKVPHAYFGWTEGNPIIYLLKFLAFGEGDTAPVSREVLRQAEPDPERRPRIHLG
jgi:antibiotic biosynthesis monooxygenase (ABM) superfamily enzyme